MLALNGDEKKNSYKKAKKKWPEDSTLSVKGER